MAIIGKGKKIPETRFHPWFKKLGKNQVCVLTQTESDEGLYTSLYMVLSILLTTMFRWGIPIRSSNIRKIAQLGIFFTWEIGPTIGKLCDEGFFSRQHVGLEEFFHPDEKFYKLVKKTPYEVREEIE